MRWNSVCRLRSSVWSVLRNLRRAGTLKKRLRTRMLVHTGHCTASCLITSDPLISSSVPSSSCSVRVCISTCDTAHILGSASPRNPIVCRLKRSAASRIFDVACRSKAMRASVSLMPRPLSMTCSSVLPASRTTICMVSAPASSEFSTSSFRQLAGRCITSPAAIWLATLSGSNRTTSIFVSAEQVIDQCDTEREHYEEGEP